MILWLIGQLEIELVGHRETIRPNFSEIISQRSFTKLCQQLNQTNVSEIVMSQV